MGMGNILPLLRHQSKGSIFPLFSGLPFSKFCHWVDCWIFSIYGSLTFSSASLNWLVSCQYSLNHTVFYTFNRIRTLETFLPPWLIGRQKWTKCSAEMKSTIYHDFSRYGILINYYFFPSAFKYWKIFWSFKNPVLVSVKDVEPFLILSGSY